MSDDSNANTLALNVACEKVLTEVIRVSDCDDAWYQLAEASFLWLFEGLGFDADVANRVVDETLSGRFASWESPSDETRRSVEGRLAAAAQAVLDS